ncbi:MAG: TIGR02450 family Trp-rich protein [Steroidobacteraceae bacterium]
MLRQIDPKKLLLSKWTAVTPINKQKHFLVSKLVTPDPPATKIVLVELEAVQSRHITTLPWRELSDTSHWHQGWI